MARRYPAGVRDPRVERWAASGAMALTGTAELPLGPPERLVEGVEELARPFAGLHPLALLGERAALMGLWRRGATSCGGSCRLFRARSGFVAVSLPRHEDMDLVPAWLELDHAPPSAPAVWSAVERAVAAGQPDELVARAAWLGLPVSRVGEAGNRPGVVGVPLGPAPRRDLSGLRVVDLSALWAGPLCGDLLAGERAEVIKVESTSRPDGARRGPAAFFDLLNGRKRSVALDFTSAEGRNLLRGLVSRADVVLEASRPRALEQLGIDALTTVAGRGEAAERGSPHGPQVWISITGHGRGGPVDRVAFGDDAAAAGGLVVWHDGVPLFCADAAADPLSGLAAARACLETLAGGGRWLLDISMADVSAELAGPTLSTLSRSDGPPAPDGLAPAEPRARRPARVAPELGADTSAVLSELGLGGG